MTRSLAAIVFLFVILFALSRGLLFNINSECKHVTGTTIYKCGSLKSGKYTMMCDNDVSRVMFMRYYESVEINIFSTLTPNLHNIKVQLGECPVINSDIKVRVEVDDELCQVHFLFELNACKG